MALPRAPGPHWSGLRNVIVVVAVSLTAISLARGFPLEGRELDSAVEGVQKYLESSGFPKMTRGEVMDFLDDFSRNSRVSRSDNAGGGSGKRDNSPQTSPRADDTDATTTAKIPKDDSPLNYGYPMSMRQQDAGTAAVPSTTPMIFVTAMPAAGLSKNDSQPGGAQKPLAAPQQLSVADVLRNAAAPKKSIVPPADLNAYSKFKKIPEARNLKIDDEMKDFLGGFGLLDDAAPKPSVGDDKPRASKEAQRRNGDDGGGGGADTVDQQLLESILAETGNGRPANASRSLQPFLDGVTNRADHVFNPSDSRVKTVDVNRIAKIVENIRLLSEDNNTIALPQDVFQEKLENITAAIAAIDQPTDDNKVFNDGYEVFFDDNSKEIDSDLPESPAADGAPAAESLEKVRNPPDPLSTDELQQLFEKNKNDVKRQEPVADTTVADDVASSSTEQQTEQAVSTSEPTVTTTTMTTTTTTTTTTAKTTTTPPARTTAASTTTDSSSEASSTVEVTSDANAARIMTTTAADNTNPSLSQLAESFGGSDTGSELQQTDVIETPSNRPRNGLYFYVDWNSFLTVNQGQKNQVNLRFAPKAGNPAHFLRVTVP